MILHVNARVFAHEGGFVEVLLCEYSRVSTSLTRSNDALLLICELWKSNTSHILTI